MIFDTQNISYSKSELCDNQNFSNGMKYYYGWLNKADLYLPNNYMYNMYR